MSLTIERVTGLHQSVEKRQSNVVALDGLRGIAIFSVMLFHLMPRTFAVNGFSPLGFGWCGVDLFFVLSGFLITGTLLATKGKSHFFRNFFARRTLRIFPLYYMTLIIVMFAASFTSWISMEASLSDQVWLWLYASNIVCGIKAFPYRSLNHFWSLAVEEQFYLAWPFLVYFLTTKAFTRVCWFCVAMALCFRIVFVCFTPWTTAAYTLTPCRVDGLACGALIALSLQRREFGEEGSKKTSTPWSNRRLWCVMASCICLFVGWSNDISFYNPIILTIGLSVLAMFFGVTVAIAATSKGIAARILSFPPLTLMGKYSYALYVFHPLVHGSIVRLVALVGTKYPKLAYLAGGWTTGSLALVLSLIAAWLSWHVLESRFLHLKRLFY